MLEEATASLKSNLVNIKSRRELDAKKAQESSKTLEERLASAELEKGTLSQQLQVLTQENSHLKAQLDDLQSSKPLALTL